MSNILVLGGDGYLGWPISLYLANSGHKVTILDSLVKRKWEMESGSEPLFEVLPLHRRIKNYQDATGNNIRIHIGDITNISALYHVFDLVQPEIVIHCAGQASAPFSMKNRTNAIITQENNYLGTINTLFAMQRMHRGVQLIKLGSLGVYGTPGIDIGEGYLDLDLSGCKDTLPFPYQPGSFKELSEASASSALFFACRNWDLKITELRLGIVYGMETQDSETHRKLNNSFHYDAIFGTSANRFSVQSAIGYPLTVYGSGTQRRAFISLSNVVEGVEMVLQNPPINGALRVLNHFSEVMTIRELAERIQACALDSGLSVEIEHVKNPRVEMEEHHYNPDCRSFKEMGFKYSMLEETLTTPFFMKILEAKDRIDLAVMDQPILWRKH